MKEWQGEVVFLHEVVPGAADRSYGIQVAKLAGLPPSVIERAKVVLGEAGGRGPRHAARLRRPAAVRRRPPKPAAPDPRQTRWMRCSRRCRRINPDEMSPREALEALYALKSQTK